MILDQREKFQRTHLEGRRYILEGVNQNHVVKIFVGLQEGAPVISHDVNISGQVEIFLCNRGDFLVNLNADNLRGREIFPALFSESPSAHA